MPPLFLGEGVVRDHPLPVPLQQLGRLREVLLVRQGEAPALTLGACEGLGVRDPLQVRSHLRLCPLENDIQDVDHAVIPAALLSWFRPDMRQRAPDSNMPVGHGVPGLAMGAGL